MARTLTRRRGAAAAAVVLAAGALVAVSPSPAPAATVTASIRDNAFTPQELRIDPGDTVTWTHVGTRVHDVTSDTGDFASGDLQRGATFSHTFRKEGFYYYHCSFHGRSGRVGMWGVVIVGDPPPPHDGGGDDEKRPQIAVPGDFATIQAAVDSAAPGSTIVVAPGRYKGDVVVRTDDLVVRGADRFRTILDGDDTRGNGFVVTGADRVTIANLTVRDFRGSGIRFAGTTRFTAARVDAVNNHTHGIYAAGSYDGVIRRSFAWGSGHSAFYVGSCMGCGALVDEVRGEASYAGFSGTNATGLTVRDSTWVHNGAGIVSTSAPDLPLAPGRGTLVVGNVVRDNDYGTWPPPGESGRPGTPFGTGIWLNGVANNVVRDNVVADQARYGILVTESDGYLPESNTVVRNRITGVGVYALAWDGTGSDDCFSANEVVDATGPPDIQTLYACAARPFAGTPYGPVREDVAAAIAEGEERDTRVPGEPVRPRCQKGRMGCHRH